MWTARWGARTQALLDRQIPGGYVAGEANAGVAAAEEAVAWLRQAHPEWLPKPGSSSGIADEATLIDLFVERLAKRGAP